MFSTYPRYLDTHKYLSILLCFGAPHSYQLPQYGFGTMILMLGPCCFSKKVLGPHFSSSLHPHNPCKVCSHTFMRLLTCSISAVLSLVCNKKTTSVSLSLNRHLAGLLSSLCLIMCMCRSNFHFGLCLPSSIHTLYNTSSIPLLLM